MKKLFFLIGASGSGKTTAIKELEKLHLPNVAVLHFDSIGVPSFDEMIKQYGSTDEWQRVKTFEWVEKIAKSHPRGEIVIFDAQTRPSFIEEACKKADVIKYATILFDCSSAERKARLEKRGQPELADENMMDWAKYLRVQCSQVENCTTLDTTKLSVEESTAELKKFVSNL